MEKKYQVFVSSTYSDLQEERKEVIQALLELDCIPMGMEMFPATNDDQWTLITRILEDCDYYILIIGGMYGSISDEGISYTQKEYEYAKTNSIPIIAFIHGKEGEISRSKSETDPEKIKKLDDFKKNVLLRHNKFWNSPADLGSKVSRSLVRLIKDYPRDGWVKATHLPSESIYKENLELRKKVDFLELELKNVSLTPPKGAENLANDIDTIDIFYDYIEITTTTSFRNGFGSSSAQSFKVIKFSVTLTWNEIYRDISPLMIDEASENSLKEKLIELCRNKNETNEAEKVSKHLSTKFYNSFISENSFNEIKVQLRALGLIMKSDKRKSLKSDEKFWCLTDYGDLQMTKLIAKKK